MAEWRSIRNITAVITVVGSVLYYLVGNPANPTDALVTLWGCIIVLAIFATEGRG